MKYLKLWENFSSDKPSEINIELDDKFLNSVIDDSNSEEIEKEIAEQEELERNSRKETHKERIKAEGENFMDAVLRRVKTLKNTINDINSDNHDLKMASVEYAFQELEDLKEMGYEAKEYAKNLEKVFKKTLKENNIK